MADKYTTQIIYICDILYSIVCNTNTNPYTSVNPTTPHLIPVLSIPGGKSTQCDIAWKVDLDIPRAAFSLWMKVWLMYYSHAETFVSVYTFGVLNDRERYPIYEMFPHPTDLRIGNNWLTKKLWSLLLCYFLNQWLGSKDDNVGIAVKCTSYISVDTLTHLLNSVNGHQRNRRALRSGNQTHNTT